jgi:hypothetical protein
MIEPTKQIILPSKLPIDIQNLIAEFIPDFIPWSINAHIAGFRRFTFTKLPKDLSLCGPPIIVNDLITKNKLNTLSPNLKWDVEFENNPGHIALESLSGLGWKTIITKKTIEIIGKYLKILKIPSEIRQLRYLRNIRIMDCEIGEYVVDNIWQLTNLREFTCIYNTHALVIPKQITCLTSIRILNIKTDVIPNELSQLKTLTELRIYGGDMYTIPELYLPNLEVFHITDTMIGGCIPKWISNLSKLTELNLSNNMFNDFVKIPQRLDYFSIAENKFDELPEKCGRWLKVTNFDFSDNYIEEIPKSFQYLDDMRECVMTGNPLRVIPSGLIMLERTCEFYFDEYGDDCGTRLSEQDKTFLRSCYNEFMF